MNRFLLFGVSLVLISPLTIFMQYAYVDARYQEYERSVVCPWCEITGREDVVFIPVNASVMKLLAPADPDFLADLLWLKTAGYYGKQSLTTGQYPYLAHLVDLITDLSPRWDYPYWFGAVILPMEANAVEDGLYIIEKALVHHPKDWVFWFYKGFTNFYYLENKTEAAEALYKAANLPEAPRWLARLAATLATKAGQRELALRYLESTLENIQDERQRQLIIEKMEEVMAQ